MNPALITVRLFGLKNFQKFSANFSLIFIQKQCIISDGLIFIKYAPVAQQDRASAF